MDELVYEYYHSLIIEDWSDLVEKIKKLNEREGR